MKNIQKKYKFAVIAVDVAIFTIKEGKLQVLLIKMKKEPYKRHWAAPGGLIGGNESLKKAAQRVLREKAGVKDVYLEQLYAFGDPDRDPFGRVVSIAYFALIPSLDIALKTTKEYDDVSWFPMKSLPPLAYDHREIIKKALKRLQSQIANSNIAYSLLPQKFTLTDLQKTYEIILGRKLDKRNFRKKILSLEIVRKTRKRQSGAANRPAELYEFSSRQSQKAEII
ncbi:MAG: NUDIX domain-containing protein [Parcubacteria group bacterium]|jgi:8-oxo-dGTP diphosphatase